MKDQDEGFQISILSESKSTSALGSEDLKLAKRRESKKASYQKNREKYLDKARRKYEEEKKSKAFNNQNIIPLFPMEQIYRPTPTSTSPLIEKKTLRVQWKRLFSKDTLILLFLQLLVFANTYFLMTETAHFYASKDQGGINPWLKASLLEGAVIAFSIFGERGSTRRTRKSGFTRFMSILIYAYTLWVVSGNALTQVGVEKNQYQVYQKEVTTLETEIERLTALRNRYFEAKRSTLAMQLQSNLREIQSRKELLQTSILKTPNSKYLLNTLLALVAFRFLVMITNLYCLQELSKRYRLCGRGV